MDKLKVYSDLVGKYFNTNIKDLFDDTLLKFNILAVDFKKLERFLIKNGYNPKSKVSMGDFIIGKFGKDASKFLEGLLEPKVLI